MKKKRFFDKPRQFFNSVEDYGYYREKLYFIYNQQLSRYRRKEGGKKLSETSGDVAEVDFAQSLVRAFRLCWPDGYGGKPSFSEYFDDRRLDEHKVFLLIKEAFEKFGLDALRIRWMHEIGPGLSVLERFRDTWADFEHISDGEPFPVLENNYTNPERQRLELLHEIGAAICEFLRYYRIQARGSQDAEVRTRAKKRLNAIFSALIPKGQGKKPYPVNHSEIKEFFLTELFRLYQIHHALGSGSKSFSLRAKAASENFNLSVEVVRKLQEFDPYGEPNRKSLDLKLKKLALELTEDRFRERTAARTIRNCISS